MKYVWTEEDIVAGRYVCRPRQTTGKDQIGIDAKWTYKIGFQAGEDDSYVLVAMTDGMVTKPKSKENMAAYLNKDEFIPCPHWRLIEVLTYLRDAYER